VLYILNSVVTFIPANFREKMRVVATSPIGFFGGERRTPTGQGIRNLNRLNKTYGKTNWRKLKGICRVELENGAVLDAEVHWKIKRYL
jgi:hypothetical protein